MLFFHATVPETLMNAVAFVESACDRPCGRPIQRTPRHGRGFYPVFFIGRFRESGQQRSNGVDPFRIVEPMAPSGFAQRYNRMAQGGQMADIKRISVQQAYAKTKANQALLVCAYEDEAKCRMLNLDGSISFASLQSRAASLPKTQEIIFY